MSKSTTVCTSARRTIAVWWLALAAVVATPSALASDESDLLPVEQAFAISAEADGEADLRLTIAIADGYYLYRDKLRVRSGDGVMLGEPVLPAAATSTDEFFGEMAIWRGTVEIPVPVLGRDGSRDAIDLVVGLQGCHERDPRVCYPPHRLSLSVPMSRAASAAAPLAAPAVGTAAGALSGLAPSSAVDLLANPRAGGPPLGATERVPLPEAEAFRVEAIASPADAGLRVRFSMPEGYYLYQDKTAFRIAGEPGLALGAPAWPQGAWIEDAHFGRMRVHFGVVEVPLPIVGAVDPAAPRRAELVVDFMGCQQDGICYPPMTRTIALALPPVATLAPTATALTEGELRAADAAAVAEVPRSESDRLADRLREDNRLLVLGVFFLLGLGLAFTPCVLPMLPILSGIIAGAGAITAQRATWLSGVYVLATAAVFTVVGVIAGLAGQNLAAILQKPLVLAAFAGVFVVLALGMFGFYELQLPNAITQRIGALNRRASGGSTAGVALMGVLSALLVGPCVAPPLAGAVLYIGQQQDPVFGGAALFALALGMGAPLVAFGASAGKLMPKAGPWMETIKAVFGVVFLWLALWMLERVVDPVWIMLAAGVLLVATGVHMGALERLPEDASGWTRTWKGMGFVLVALGVIQFLGVAAGGRDPLRPLAVLAGGTTTGLSEPTPRFRMVEDAAALDRELGAAATAGRPALLDFYADWCVECKRMERTTFTDPAVRVAMDDFVLLKIDVTDQNADHRALQQRFGIIGPPATLFFPCATEERRALRLVGYEAAAPFAARLAQGRRCG